LYKRAHLPRAAIDNGVFRLGARSISPRSHPRTGGIGSADYGDEEVPAMDTDLKNASIRSGMLVAVIGLGALGYFGWTYYLQSAAASWPTAKATVTTSRITEELSVSRRGATTFYVADIRYQYAVGGDRFTGSDLWFNSRPSSTIRADMEKLLAEYPVGKSMFVYYDPGSPQRSVVMPTKQQTIVRWGIGIGVVGLFVGLAMILGGLTSTNAAKGSVPDRMSADATMNTPFTATTR
jgi:hypothetical protein